MPCSIIHGQLAPVVSGVILYERIGIFGGERGYHSKFLTNNQLPIQDVVVGVVAIVHDKREIHHKALGVALAVGASVRIVGRKAVVGEKLGLALAIDDDASACAFHLRAQVDPATDHIKLLILERVRVDGEAEGRRRPVWVFRIAVAAVQGEQQGDSEQQWIGFAFHHGIETFFFRKTYVLPENSYFCPPKSEAMKRKPHVVCILLSLILLLGSCASNRSSRAIRKAERQMEKMEKQSEKNYKKAKDAHYKHQAKKTKKMIKKDKRHAERMRRRQRSNPFFS